MSDYAEFLVAKTQFGSDDGFAPTYMPDCLFDFQRDLAEWALIKGRSAIFADCGLGKTPMQFVWAQNVVEKTNKPVLILAPLAVGVQTEREGAKFGVEVTHCRAGHTGGNITVTNYEQLEHYDPSMFAGVVCDESSILKNFDGATRSAVTEFMRTIPYRLLCTATAAPNDFIELGTSSEALGHLGHIDMLQRFFKNDQNTVKPMVYHHRGTNFAQLDERAKWRFKGHAEEAFWQWVCSWARACRKPSDLGYDDDGFILPPLTEQETIVPCSRPLDGRLFVLTAQSLPEQRAERRMTIEARCQAVAEKVDHAGPAVVWCHLNDEGDLLERMIPGAIQVAGAQSDEEKEERLEAFTNGEARVIVTKPRIAGFGLNWQHCSHVVVFPSHSYEQYYQSVRRCWRFGQKSPVTVDIVTTEGELAVLKNLQRKSAQADQMFTSLTRYMNEALHIEHENLFTETEGIPSWL